MHPASAPPDEPVLTSQAMSVQTNPLPGPARVVRLDPQALAKLGELDPLGRRDVLTRVLTAYETSLARMLTQLRNLGPAGQAEAVAALAHKMKSSSASVGALDLARACAEVDQKWRSRDQATLQLDISRLISEGGAALAAVAAILRP
jgi:histidine phosphotransfer protein HptB